MDHCIECGKPMIEEDDGNFCSECSEEIFGQNEDDDDSA